MNQFITILSKIKERLNLEQNKISDIQEVIAIETKIEIPLSQIKIQKNTLVLQVSPTIKMAILSKKEKILSLLQERGIKIFSIR